MLDIFVKIILFLKIFNQNILSLITSNPFLKQNFSLNLCPKAKLLYIIFFKKSSKF